MRNEEARWGIDPKAASHARKSSLEIRRKKGRIFVRSKRQYRRRAVRKSRDWAGIQLYRRGSSRGERVIILTFYNTDDDGGVAG